MTLNSKIKSQKINPFLIYIIFGTIAFSFNFWVSTRGVFPIDTFLHYDSAFKILNGEKPVRDFWIIHGISLDYIQSIFFRLFGVNWVSYISHSSIFNSIIVVVLFKLLKNLDLSLLNSSIICLCFLTLAYPVSGVPFIDHHSTFLSFFCFIIFFYSINNKKYNSILFIPLLFGLAFFSKPVPSSYLIIIFSIIFTIYFWTENKIKPFLILVLGTVLFFFLLILFLKFEKIPLTSFIDQLILYPLSIGGQRTEFISDAISNRFFNYKFIYLLIIYLVFFLIKNQNYLKFSKENLYLFFMIISFTIIMIIHQIFTKNQNFIFFLIPLNVGLVLYFNNQIKFKNFKIFNLFFIVFCILLTFKYNERFNDKRKFHDLQNVKLENAIDASIIDETLSPLKWITSSYENPYDEVRLIKKILKFIESSDQNILLITNHNFIDSISNKKVFSFVKNFDPVTVPIITNDYDEKFKEFFNAQFIKKEINEILIFLPSRESLNKIEESLIRYADPICFKRKAMDKSISLIKIKSC